MKRAALKHRLAEQEAQLKQQLAEQEQARRKALSTQFAHSINVKKLHNVVQEGEDEKHAQLEELEAEQEKVRLLG